MPAQAPAPALNTQGPMTTALFGPSGPGTAKKPSSAAAPTAPVTPPDISTPPPGASTSDVPPGAFSDLQSALLSSLKNLQQIEAEPGPTPPPPMSLPPPPVQAPYNPIHSWGSAAMMLALVGSAFTRHPITAALNAGSQVMQAYNQGNATAAQNATDTWKTQTENALKLYQYEQDAYTKAITAHQDNVRDALTAVSVQAAAFKDAPMAAAAQTGGLQGVVDMVHKRGKAAANLAGVSSTLDKENTRHMNGDAATDAYLNNRYASWIPAYVLNGFNKAFEPPMSYSEKSDDRMVFDKGVEDFMKGYNLSPVQLSSRKATVDALNSNIKKLSAQQSQAQASSQTFAQQWKYIQDNLLAKGAPSTDVGPVLNNYLQSGSISSGNPDTVAYVTALGTLAEEYAKVISGSTGAAGSTVNAQEFARSLFQQGYNKEQITAAIDAAQANMAAREQQYPALIDQMQNWISSIPGSDTGQAAQAPEGGGVGDETPPPSPPTPAPTAPAAPSGGKLSGKIGDITYQVQ